MILQYAKYTNCNRKMAVDGQTLKAKLNNLQFYYNSCPK